MLPSGGYSFSGSSAATATADVTTDIQSGNLSFGKSSIGDGSKLDPLTIQIGLGAIALVAVAFLVRKK